MIYPDYDKPVDSCPTCGLAIWKSLISGNLIKSCNCVKPKTKKEVKK